MEERTYFISEVSKLVGVEPHVLRYWEEELGLKIERNSQGKRCYSREDVSRLQEAKRWKDKGMQLKAVKEILEERAENDQEEEQRGEKEEREYEIVPREEGWDSMKKFEFLLDTLIVRALERNNETLVREICDEILERMEIQMEEKVRDAAGQELLRELLGKGERESAASSQKRRESIWKRWKRKLEEYWE